MRTYSLSSGLFRLARSAPLPPRLSGVTADIGILALLRTENNVSAKNRQNICAVFFEKILFFDPQIIFQDGGGFDHRFSVPQLQGVQRALQRLLPDDVRLVVKQRRLAAVAFIGEVG
jgi:hypothetical protein